jgi:nicotinamidase-related amidase
MAWARHEKIFVISTVDVCHNNDGSKTDLCMDGTNGERKIPYTLLSNRASFPADDNNALPADLFHAHRQVILHKRCIDPFDEPRIERLLSEVQADEFIVIGARTEEAVKATALGLLQRGKAVRVVLDAVGSYDRKEAKLALRKMQTKGARLTVTENLAGLSHLRHVGACKCESCCERAKSTSLKYITKIKRGRRMRASSSQTSMTSRYSKTFVKTFKSQKAKAVRVKK